MKRYGRIVTMIATGILLITTAYAFTGEAGSSSDPVVTKSYVDQKIAQLGSAGNGNNSGVSTDVAKQLKDQQDMIEILVNELNQLKSQTSSTYEIVTVPEGKSIIGKQGTEIIIRTGEGKAIGSEAGGLQDMTLGADISNGMQITPYHLIIIPREDGRGIKATTSLIVMVRGGYSIQ